MNLHRLALEREAGKPVRRDIERRFAPASYPIAAP
jgi:hypothetical protein